VRDGPEKRAAVEEERPREAVGSNKTRAEGEGKVRLTKKETSGEGNPPVARDKGKGTTSLGKLRTRGCREGRNTGLGREGGHAVEATVTTRAVDETEERQHSLLGKPERVTGTRITKTRVPGPHKRGAHCKQLTKRTVRAPELSSTKMLKGGEKRRLKRMGTGYGNGCEKKRSSRFPKLPSGKGRRNDALERAGGGGTVLKKKVCRGECGLRHQSLSEDLPAEGGDCRGGESRRGRKGRRWRMWAGENAIGGPAQSVPPKREGRESPRGLTSIRRKGSKGEVGQRLSDQTHVETRNKNYRAAESRQRLLGGP